MIKFIILSLLIISSCSRQIRSCDWGDCVNGWGYSTSYQPGVGNKLFNYYEGSHKDSMRHGGGVTYGNFMNNGNFLWYDKGKAFDIYFPDTGWGIIGGFGPPPGQILDPPIHLVEYYTKTKEAYKKAKSTIPNKWDAIIDDGLSIFRQNISGFPVEVQGKWVIAAVSFNQGADSFETGKLLGVAHQDNLEIYQKGLGTPHQSIAQSFTTYTQERRIVTKSQIWRHNGQEGVILIEMNSYTGKIKYQLYDLDYDVKKPFAPRKKGGKYLVIHYDLRDIEIARFIVEIQ